MSHKHSLPYIKSTAATAHELKEVGKREHFGLHKTHVGMGREIIKSPKAKLH